MKHISDVVWAILRAFYLLMAGVSLAVAESAEPTDMWRYLAKAAIFAFMSIACRPVTRVEVNVDGKEARPR